MPEQNNTIKSHQRRDINEKLVTIFQGFLPTDEVLNAYLNSNQYLEYIYAGLGIPAHLLKNDNSPALLKVAEQPHGT